MRKPELQFQAAKRVYNGDEGLPGAVAKTLDDFTRKVSGNLRRGQGTVVATVTNPEDDAYFAVVLAGPFENLKTLRAALSQVADGAFLEHLKLIGLDEVNETDSQPNNQKGDDDAREKDD